MKLKDLIGISLVSLFLFPIILIGIMLAAGVVHIEFGDGKDKDRLKPAFSSDDAAKQEMAEAKHLKAFKALEVKEKEIQAQQVEVDRETERLENLKQETAKAKEEIAEHQRKIEELVGKSSEMQDKQIASLAEVYGGMRPDEAAPILLSLDNALVVRIIRKIPETRATSKLMAALASLNVARAAQITVLLGGKVKSSPEAKGASSESDVHKPAAVPASAPSEPTKEKPTDGKPEHTPPEAKHDGPGGKA